MQQSILSFVAASLVSAVAGQQPVTVPARHAALDADTLCEVAGLTQRLRQQLLVRASSLDAARGQHFVSLAFRRDGQHRAALGAGATDLAVTLSQGAPDPSLAQAVFAANVGTGPSRVFVGRIALPASPELPHRHAATWQAPNAVVVPFAQPFAYTGGTLCIDLQGEPVAGAAARFWPIDASLVWHDALVTPVGSACDARLSAHASRATLVPGGTVRLLSAGPARSLGVAMLGAAPQMPGLDLGFLHAAGCKAYLSPVVTLSSTYSSPARGTYGDVSLKVGLPPLATLLGGVLGVQWLNYPNPTTPSGLATSHGLELRIASAPWDVEVAQVRTGPLAPGVDRAQGEVMANVAPVLRLLTQ